MKYCSQCGKPMEDDAKFCPGCGKAVTASSFQPKTPAAPTQEVPKVKATIVNDAGDSLRKKLSILYLIGAVLTALFLVLTPKAGGVPVFALLLCFLLPIAAWVVTFFVNKGGASYTALIAATVISVILTFFCGSALFAGDVNTTLFHVVLVLLAIVILALLGKEIAGHSK